MEERVWKAGTYIVLLKALDPQYDNPWASSIPEGYCYKLSIDSYEDGRGFFVDVDNANNKSNGWSGPSSKLRNKFREATQQEINEYDLLGKPFKVTNLPEVIEDYNYLIKIINKINKNYERVRKTPNRVKKYER